MTKYLSKLVWANYRHHRDIFREIMDPVLSGSHGRIRDIGI